MSTDDRQPEGAPAAPQPDAPAAEERRGEGWEDLRWAAPLLIALVLITPLVGYYATSSGLIPLELGLPPGYLKWEQTPPGEENMDNMTARIFDVQGLVVPFEILSVLLLAALVAGVVIAFRDPERDA